MLLSPTFHALQGEVVRALRRCQVMLPTGIILVAVSYLLLPYAGVQAV